MLGNRKVREVWKHEILGIEIRKFESMEKINIGK